MSTWLRKIFRDMQARRGRTLLVANAIFIGVAGTVALFSMGDILVRQLESDIREDDVAMVNVLVTTNFVTALQGSDNTLDLLSNFPNLTEVQGSMQETIRFKVNSQAAVYYEANLLSYSGGFKDLPIEPMRLLDGEFPEAGKKQLVVERRFAQRYNLKVDDPLHLEVQNPLNRGVLSRRDEAWTITGIVFHPYVLAPSDSIYVHPSDNQYLTGTWGYNVFSARFNDYSTAHGAAKFFADFILTDTPYMPIFTQRQDPAQNPLLLGARRLSETMSTLALIALFVSAFLVFNVISTVVSEQRRQIGAMKALGATRGDMFKIYGGLALAYGILGTVPGAFVGAVGGLLMAKYLGGQVNTTVEGIHVSPLSILIGIVAGLGVPVLASILPVWYGSKITILEAMSDQGISSNYRQNVLDVAIARIPSQTVRSVLRNIQRKGLRMAFTLLTLAIAVGAFMGIYAVFNSVTLEVAEFFATFDNSIRIGPQLENNPRLGVSLLAQYLREHPEVGEELLRGFRVPVEIEGIGQTLTIPAFGYDLNALDLPVIDGETLNEDNETYGVVLSEDLAASLGKRIGDEVQITLLGQAARFRVVGLAESESDALWMVRETMALAAGYQNYLPRPNEYLSVVHVEGYTGVDEVTIVGLDADRAETVSLIAGRFFEIGQRGIIISEGMAHQGGYQVGDSLTLESGQRRETYTISGIFTPPPQLDVDLRIPEDFAAIYWGDLLGLEGRMIEDIPPPDSYLPYLSDIQIDDLGSEVTDFLSDVGLPTSLFNFVGLLEALSRNLQTFQVILSAVALLIAVVGALGLFSTLSMSVYERQREIGIMRSVGADTWTIMQQFLLEGLLVGLGAWLIGLPIGYAMASLLLDVMGLSDTLDVIFTVDAALLGLGGIITLTLIASLWPALLAARRTISDILRYS